MTDATPQFWSQMGEAFQQNLGKSFAQAMQHFQTIDLGGLGKDMPSVPQIQFEPAKLQQLQSTYFQEATELWNQSLHNSLKVQDRRFSSEAWNSNPVAAFNAATYLLNARTLMGLADAVQGVREGKSLTDLLARVPADLRPGTQALTFAFMLLFKISPGITRETTKVALVSIFPASLVVAGLAWRGWSGASRPTASPASAQFKFRVRLTPCRARSMRI